MKKLLGTAAAAFAAVLLLGMSVFAFDANDYDYSYDYDDYDYDDYDYDYGGGYSYSYDDDDDDYGGYSSGGGSGDGDWGTVIFGFLLIGGLLLWGSWDSKRNGKRKGNTPQNRPQPGNKSFQKSVPNRNAEIADAVRRFDPSFDSGAMTAFAQKTFVDVQNAWCARDLEPVRGVMHNNLYNTTKKQVQAKIDQHVTYHYENYTFRNAYLTSYVRDSEYEYITAYLNVEYIDYQTNDDTGEIIKGDKTTMWKMRYLMKFMRSTAGSSGAQKFCPNCGAPLDISSTGKCEYCGSTVTTGSFDWLLSDFTTVRADTKDDGIRV